jgi:hypothetical protein
MFVILEQVILRRIGQVSGVFQVRVSLDGSRAF